MEVQEFLQALAREISVNMGQGQKGYQPHGLGFKAGGTPSNTAYLYESGGLFGVCDGPSTLINAMVGPIGAEGIFRWVGTDTEREFVDAFKAVTETGSEQSTSCGDCVRVGMTACAQFYCFGRFCRQTDELLFDRIGVKAHSNIPTKTLFGAITDAAGQVLVGNGETIRDAFYLQSKAVGYALRLKNATLLWSGNPANNNAAYQEYMGLDLIINTGKYDAYTMLDCDSIDSFLMNFGYNNPQSAGTYAIQNWFRRMILQFMRRSEGAGLAWESAQHHIVMTPNMWDAVAKAYACSGLDLCAGVSTSRVMQQSADQARMRYEEYLERLALPVYGRWYPVTLDSQISETTGQANGICSDIYFITTSIDGREVTYGQYQDFNATYGRVRQEMVSLFGSDDIAITDNGRYALVRDNSRGCFDVQAYTKPRVVSEAPWLCGRIQNVCADMLQQPLPDVTGSGRTYELDGGRTTSPIPVLYGACDETLS